MRTAMWCRFYELFSLRPSHISLDNRTHNLVCKYTTALQPCSCFPSPLTMQPSQLRRVCNSTCAIVILSRAPDLQRSRFLCTIQGT